MSMTWYSYRLSQRSFGEDPMMMVYQIQKNLNQTSDSLHEHLLVKLIGKSIYYVTH